jgi:uroporphyrinogen III methyltransferase/synthase
VVRLREKLSWYERLPLFGRRIVITRAAAQASELRNKLHALGAEVLELPVISLEAPPDPLPLEEAIAHLSAYDWLIFTSTNGVRFFTEALDRSKLDMRATRARICAIGPATARALAELHLKVDLMPDRYVAESLVAAFDGVDLQGSRVLIPRAAVARDLIPLALAKAGAQVDVVEAYRNVVPADAEERAREILRGARRPDWITFTSSSTVNNFLEIAGREALNGLRVASIGPVTSETLHANGVAVDVEAAEFTIDGLLAAIVAGDGRL